MCLSVEFIYLIVDRCLFNRRPVFKYVCPSEQGLVCISFRLSVLVQLDVSSYIRLEVYRSVCPYTGLSVCLSVYKCICNFNICLLVDRSICSLSVYRSICLSVGIYFCLSDCLDDLSVEPSVCPSLSCCLLSIRLCFLAIALSV